MERETSESSEVGRPLANPTEPQSLEGTLFQRKDRHLYGWKRRYVVLNLTDGGSISCYRSSHDSGAACGEDDESVKEKKVAQRFGIVKKKKTYSKLHWPEAAPLHREKKVPQAKRAAVRFEFPDDRSGSASMAHLASINRQLVSFCNKVFSSMDRPRLYLPAEAAWVLQDVENDASLFRILVPPSEELDVFDDESSDAEDNDIPSNSGARKQKKDDDENVQLPGRSNGAGKKPRYLYFRCPGKGNEKALWLKAAASLNRLSISNVSLARNKVFYPVSKVAEATSRVGVSRTRSVSSAEFAKQASAWSIRESPSEQQRKKLALTLLKENDGDGLGVGPSATAGEKEYKVFPPYAYPHRWMTHAELYNEMIRPSSCFHDLRIPNNKGQENEIGTLHVEVLGCMGLPKLDRFSKTDSVCYMVCGSYAFSTDVIPDRLNPMWPRHSRRACIFPLFHAYAQLFVGVFDDDGVNANDEFAGRVVVDVARLRPSCTYDVTLPLRQSSFVYNRRRRGAVRLRFRVEWVSERDAVLSYLPRKSVKRSENHGHTPPATIQCADLKSFRNVALTVHGSHLPGRFTTKIFKATSREVNLYRVMLQAVVKDTVKGIVGWENPVVSMFVFLGWMHCIKWNSVSLVPSYVLSCILVFLIRNYSRYNTNARLHRGYAPLSIEEMLLALIDGGQKSNRHMTPLEMKRSSAMSSTRKLFDSNHSQRRIFLGLSEDECLNELGLVGEDHAEFPFSDKELYPKISVKESLVVQKRSREGKDVDKWSQLASADSLFSDGEDEEEDDEEFELDAVSEKGERALTNQIGSSNGAKVDVADLSLQRGMCKQQTDGVDATTQQHKRTPLRPVQDSDVRVAAKKKMQDRIMGIKDNLQETTFRVFDDRIYTQHLTSSAHPDEGLQPGKSVALDEVTTTDLDKHLGIKNHSNPVTAKVAVYIGPLVEMAKIGLCATRATFNIFMWQDPYLSFWISFGCLVLIPILAVFPWRAFLFLVGIVGVGPQNWIIRVVKARSKAKRQSHDPSIAEVRTAKQGASGGSFRRPGRNLFNRRKRGEQLRTSEDLLSTSDDGNPPRPVFQSHVATSRQAPNQRKNRDTVDPSTVQQVVVPYSPLLYSRFYDWPPDSAYSMVKADIGRENNVSRGALQKTGKGQGRSGVSFQDQVESAHYRLIRNSST